MAVFIIGTQCAIAQKKPYALQLVQAVLDRCGALVDPLRLRYHKVLCCPLTSSTLVLQDEFYLRGARDVFPEASD